MWNTIREIESSDRNVSKFVFEAEDAVAESVLYRYPAYEDRTVICCSTQSGCPIGCRFCGAGDAFVRSLTEDEIVSQPVHLIERTGVDAKDMKRLQIMFMSMGEPLLNLKALLPAMRRLSMLYPKAALLISTSGPRVDFAPLIYEAVVNSSIGLQFSLHESTDEARDRLIPFKNKLYIYEIASHGKWFLDATRRQPFFNYCVHDGNNSPEDADRIAKALDPSVWQATISVICERGEHVAAANARQRDLADGFRDLLMRRGFQTRLFDPAGQDDIGGGCGQLWFVQDWMRSHPEKTRNSVGMGLPIVHAPTCLPA